MKGHCCGTINIMSKHSTTYTCIYPFPSYLTCHLGSGHHTETLATGRMVEPEGAGKREVSNDNKVGQCLTYMPLKYQHFSVHSTQNPAFHQGYNYPVLTPLSMFPHHPPLLKEWDKKGRNFFICLEPLFTSFSPFLQPYSGTRKYPVFVPWHQRIPKPYHRFATFFMFVFIFKCTSTKLFRRKKNRHLQAASFWHLVR